MLVVAHILLYNSSYVSARAALKSLRSQVGESPEELTIIVSDNGSTNDTFAKLRAEDATGVTWIRHEINLGFSGGNNHVAKLFLEGDAKFLLLLNPDVRLEVDSLRGLLGPLAGDRSAGSACPRLLRSDEDLNPLPQRILDGAGMYFTRSLRHFDYGAGEPDGEFWAKDRYVFGASGACILMKREFVEDLLLKGDKNDALLFDVYPELKSGYEDRAPLFDEAFFAYREDADLAWRAQIRGWRCRYVGAAVGYHKRVVTPEVRRDLSPVLNMLGVRNRFLLQLSNYYPVDLFTFVYGFLLRNVVVVGGVVAREWSSFPAFLHLFHLLPRAIERRQLINKSSRTTHQEISRWFKKGHKGERIEK